MNLNKVTFRSFLFLALVAGAVILLPFWGTVTAGSNLNVWWPQEGAALKSLQPFKGQVEGLDPSQYEMFWEVDGGVWNWMDNNSSDYPHKEASVDVRGWSWKGSGPYKITFIARQNGTIIAQRSVSVTIENGLAQQASVTPTQSTNPNVSVVQAAPPEVTKPATDASVPTAAIVSAPVVWKSGDNTSKLYVDPNSPAAKQAKEWGSTNPNTAAMERLAAQPTARWFGNWNSDIAGDVRSAVTAATQQDATAVLVAYNIPARDCNGYSAGGSNSPAGYSSWINSFASAIGSAKAIVVLEPDAIAQLSCLSEADQKTRLTLLSSAISALKNNPNTKVYLDAGHAGWIDPAVMASNLTKANVGAADGFAVNVSNFDSTEVSTDYGQKISSALGGKHFVIDTSRNGNGSNGEWCNPSGRAIGLAPTTHTGNPLIDAYLWIKTPGESDGSCNGAPGAGQWWPDYALKLVTNVR